MIAIPALALLARVRSAGRAAMSSSLTSGSVLQALQLAGTTGDYGRRLSAVVIGFGATARGAVTDARRASCA